MVEFSFVSKGVAIIFDNYIERDDVRIKYIERIR